MKRTCPKCGSLLQYTMIVNPYYGGEINSIFCPTCKEVLGFVPERFLSKCYVCRKMYPGRGAICPSCLEEGKKHKEAVLKALAEGPLRIAEIARKTGLSYKAVESKIYKLLKKGKIERVKMGTYRLVQSSS